VAAFYLGRLASGKGIGEGERVLGFCDKIGSKITRSATE
jgi:hypothetical protein